MAITRTNMIDDDGTGKTGTIINNAWKQELYNQIDAADALLGGQWNDIAFNAANFSGTSPMTWTVGAAAVLRNRCSLVGKTLMWSMYVSWFSGSNALAGTPSASINLTVPLGLTVQNNQAQILDYTAGIAGIPPVGGIYASGLSQTLTLNKASGGNYALTDIPGFIFTIIIEVF